MIHCPRCVIDVWPVQELQQSGRLLDLCPTCKGGLTVEPVSPPASRTRMQPIVVDSLTDVGAQSPVPVPFATGPLDVIEIVRNRANAIRVEVEALLAKQAELARLDRMLAVADAAPQPQARRAHGA